MFKPTKEDNMKRFKFPYALFGVLLLVTIVGFGSCSVPSALEAQTPTGCWKRQGRYYDPMVGKCVQVTSEEQMFLLDAYRYTHQLAEEAKLSEVEYDIYFKKYMTIEEVEPLWAELRDRGATVIMVAGVLPDDRVFDPLPGFEVNEEHPTVNIWGGQGVAQGCGWMKRQDSPADTVKNMVIENIKTEEQERGKALSQVRKAVLEDNLCRVYAVDVITDPKIMPDFWDQHLDQINGIRPKVNDIDLVMRGFDPAPLTEGK
jgi:hypothetical protein